MNFTNSYSAKIENSIIIKIENEIITNYEFENKILSTLLLSGQTLNQNNIDRIKEQTLQTLIQLKLKKIELSKFNIKKDIVQINSYLNKISSGDIPGLKNKFNTNNLDYQLFLEEVEIQLQWQKFIYQIYSNKIEFDEKIINKELQEIVKDKSIITEYKISEIEILLNSKSDNNLISNLIEEIESNGFEETAFKFSISSSAADKGDLGWINSKSLSRQIFNIVSKMGIGEITNPIKRPNSVLLLKLVDKRNSNTNKINISDLKTKLINQKKNELFNLYSRSHLSKLNNTSLIEYK